LSQPTGSEHQESSRPGAGLSAPLDPELIGATAAVANGRLPLLDVPFAWQHEQRLLLLDQEAGGWTFAELRFDSERCHYVEVRRATFRWPREAAGALLARGVGFGAAPAERLAADLQRWLADHLATNAGPETAHA
jgi:hypothetical protein